MWLTKIISVQIQLEKALIQKEDRERQRYSKSGDVAQIQIHA